MSAPSQPSAPTEPPAPLARNWSPDVPEVPAPRPYDVDLYFDDRGGCYFRRDDRGNYIKATVASARRYLRTLGFSAKSEDGSPSALERVLEFVETGQNVDYASPLAGYKTGVYDMNSRRVLVTTSPNLIDPAPGSWDTLAAIFEGLLGAEQCRWFYLWAKVAIEAVRHCRYRPGQVLIVAGPAGCGKNLLQSIITAFLGGRAAKPFRYLCGRTEFNSETFVAEHLVIQDESASSDPRVRKKFGSEIKGLAVNELQSCHRKGCEALELTPIWRLSITLNDDPTSLMVLPQWEDMLADKLMLFHARSFKMPVDTGTAAGREMLWRQIRAELPAFVHHLDGLTIPEEMKDERYGVRAYHNPELLDLMDAATDETKLLEIIDGKLFTDTQVAEWTGYARELESELEGAPGLRALLAFSNTCGALLGALARKTDRVKMLPKLNGYQRWRIIPPR